MTQTQYIAIRTVLDYEIKYNTENTVLPQAIAILVDGVADYSEKDYQKLKDAMHAVSVSAAAGVCGATLASMSAGLLASFSEPPLFAAAGTLGKFSDDTVNWLKKLLKKK